MNILPQDHQSGIGPRREGIGTDWEFTRHPPARVSEEITLKRHAHHVRIAGRGGEQEA